MKKMKEINKFIKNILSIIVILIRAVPGIIAKLIMCNIGLGILTSLNLYFYKYLVDSANDSLETGSLKLTILWLCSVGLCTGMINLLFRFSTYYREIAQEYMNCHVTEIVMGKIQELDLSHFDAPETYDAIEKVSNESISRCISILVMLVTLVQNITIFIGVITVVISLSSSIALLTCLIMIPIFYVSINIAYKQYNIYTDRVQKLRMIDYLKALCLRYENIKELKIYGIVSYLKDKMTKIYGKYINEDKKYKRIFLTELTVTDLVQIVFSTGIKIFILFRTIIEKKTIGDFTMYISALDNMENSISAILESISSLYSDNLYIENLLRLIKMKSHLRDGSKTFLDKDFKIIEFKNVWFKYPDSKVYTLKNLSIKFEKGKSYALVGLNGSGKTTFVKLLMRLYDPQKGRILIDGIDIKQYSLESLHKYFGVIFQDFIKYPLSVNENIGIGNLKKIHDYPAIINAAKASGAIDFIDTLPHGFETILEKEWDEGIELSGGQWQKIAISRGILSDSSILILDEPSSALDPEAEFEMFQNMKQLMQGKMSILITHRFSNTGIVDKIFVMEAGEIIEFGTHENLMEKRGRYHTLYKLQSNAYK